MLPCLPAERGSWLLPAAQRAATAGRAASLTLPDGEQRRRASAVGRDAANESDSVPSRASSSLCTQIGENNRKWQRKKEPYPAIGTRTITQLRLRF